jgi:hypothetical protein
MPVSKGLAPSARCQPAAKGVCVWAGGASSHHLPRLGRLRLDPHLLRLHPRASKQADGPAGPQLSSLKAQLP